ncbi:MAG: hypothetical protein IKD54_07475 [Clostridia bacterium]|nr:hypothetical protein [Clostridia bacterium]
MKRILPLLLLCLLLACVPTPEQEFVVNKGDDRLAETIGKNGEDFSVEVYRGSLPERIRETVDTHSDAVSLTVDAAVVFPDWDAVPTLEVAPCGNDTDAILWLGTHMAQGGYFAKIPVDANGEKLRTKAVILSEVESRHSMSDRAEQAHPEFDAEQTAAYRASLDREIADLMQEYQSAPDAAVERIDDLRTLGVNGLIQLGLFSESGHWIADVSLVFDPKNPQREQLTIWGGGTDPECFSYWPEPIDDTDAAIRCAEQILKEIGYDTHYTVASAQEGAAGIGVICAPKVKDVSYSLGTGGDPAASYEEYFPEDTLELVFAKGTGILRYVQWIGNSRFVREASENVELLPFDEIQSIVKNDLGYLLSWTNGNVRERTIEVTSVRLEYKRIRVLNDRRRLLVPAWTVEGIVTDRGEVSDADTGAAEPFTEETRGMLLILNAIDGSLIESAKTN